MHIFLSAGFKNQSVRKEFLLCNLVHLKVRIKFVFRKFQEIGFFVKNVFT